MTDAEIDQYEDYVDFLDDIATIEDERSGGAADDKQHGHYYIGTYIRAPRGLRGECSSGAYIMDVCISPQTFFEYDFADIENYLLYYNVLILPAYLRSRARAARKIEIMKLHISDDGTYYVILKTFWLRIIQRIWRRTYRALRARGSAAAQRHFELRGSWG